nr:ribonuclease H-like domain-containing protein [Tanacetum cinerariifolium]
MVLPLTGFGDNIPNNQNGWIKEDMKEEEEDLEEDLEEDPEEDPEEDDDDMKIDDEAEVIDPYIDDGSNNTPPLISENKETPPTSHVIPDADGQSIPPIASDVAIADAAIATSGIDDDEDDTAPMDSQPYEPPVRMAHTLMEQKVKSIAKREADNKKRKWENFQRGSSSGIRWHITRSQSPKTSNSPPKLTAIQALVVSAAQGNMSYLSDFEELNGGYVTFGGNPKGGNISGKGKIKTCKMKGIKREFSVPRTPQQNGIAERKNKTLIEAARTILADLLLPIPFWAKTVNTACYVQNRVLVTKPHDKTRYELLHGRTPSIGFMRPFGCPVTILNTLDSLGKFKGKVDEGFLVRYSVNIKAFRVFNSKTCIVQETLHVNFLENKPNITGSGPTWLFDIDSFTRTMNYQPVIAGNQTKPSAGFQDKFDAEKAGEEINQQYVLFLVWSSGSTNPQNYDGDVAFDGKEHDFDAKKPESEVILSPSIKFKDCSDNSSNKVNVAGTIVPTVGQNSSNSTNPFSAPELEDITYSDDEDDVGAEADFNNLKTSITFKMQKVWVLVDLPHGKSEIGTQWVFRNKKDERGIVVRKKVRLVIQRHTQEERIDYKEVFAPVARIEAIRLFLAYASFMGLWCIKWMSRVHFYMELLRKKYLCKSFEKLMKDKFQMSSMGELTFFLGLQVKQKKDGIFISQDKYVADILRKFGLTEGKSASTPIDTEKPLLKDPDGEDVDLHT